MTVLSTSSSSTPVSPFVSAFAAWPTFPAVAATTTTSTMADIASAAGGVTFNESDGEEEDKDFDDEEEEEDDDDEEEEEEEDDEEEEEEGEEEEQEEEEVYDEDGSLIIRAGRCYDVKDALGKWFSAWVPWVGEGCAVVMYEGFFGMDEMISLTPAVIADRFAEPGSQAASGTHRVPVGGFVDLYVEELRRWVSVEVAGTRGVSNLKELQLLCQGSEWLRWYDGSIAADKAHSGNQAEGARFPGGTAAAIGLITRQLGQKKDSHAALIHCEELRARGLLPSRLCMMAFKIYDRGGVAAASEDSVENRRWCEAKAAAMLEAAFASGQAPVPTASLMGSATAATVGSTQYSNLEVPARLESSQVVFESESCRRASNSLTYFDENLTGIHKFLRYGEHFRMALGAGWMELAPRVMFLLALADSLESNAWSTTSVVTRRTLFAEAALLMRIVTEQHSTSSTLRSIVNWRLSRHYVCGLGIDLTELADQESADIQAGEYFAASMRSPYVLGQLGMMLSVGRTSVCLALGMEPTVESTLSAIRKAATKGFCPARFWLAQMLLHGWGKQTVETRKAALDEALSFFTHCCATSFNCSTRGAPDNPKILQTQVAKIVAACADDAHPHFKDPFLLLSLHAYSAALKSKVIAEFPAICLKIITDFAAATMVEIESEIEISPVGTAPAAPAPAPASGPAGESVDGDEDEDDTRKSPDAMTLVELTAEVAAAGQAEATASYESKAEFVAFVVALRQQQAASKPRKISRPLPGPGAGALSADWLATLRDKVLFARDFMSVEDGGLGGGLSKGGEDSKGGGGGQASAQRQFVALWMRNVFNASFAEAPTEPPTVLRDAGDAAAAAAAGGDAGGDAGDAGEPSASPTPTSSPSPAREPVPSDSLPRWTVNHTRALLSEILSAAELVRSACKQVEPYEVPADIVAAKLKAAGLSDAEAAGTWEHARTLASEIYCNIEPGLRTLAEQTSFHDDLLCLLRSPSRCQSAMQCIGGEGTERAAAFAVLVQAKALARSAREGEPDILHHCKSAEAVLRFCKDKSISVEAAIAKLDQLAGKFLTGHHAEYPPRIGYNIILDTLSVEQFFKTTKPESAEMNRRLQFLTENGSINVNWRRGADVSLLQMFAEWRSRIEAMQRSALPGPLAPCLAYDALTFADPWSMFSHLDIDRELSSTEWFSKAAICDVMTNFCLSETEAAEAVLTAKLAEWFRRLALPQTIPDKCSAYRSASARIQLKKKLAFLLYMSGMGSEGGRKSVDFQRGNALLKEMGLGVQMTEEEAQSPQYRDLARQLGAEAGPLAEEDRHLLSLRIAAGCDGRCPDGISSFCDNFIQELSLIRNKQALADCPAQVSRLIFAVSGLISSSKSDFIKKTPVPSR